MLQVIGIMLILLVALLIIMPAGTVYHAAEYVFIRVLLVHAPKPLLDKQMSAIKHDWSYFRKVRSVSNLQEIAVGKVLKGPASQVATDGYTVPGHGADLDGPGSETHTVQVAYELPHPSCWSLQTGSLDTAAQELHHLQLSISRNTFHWCCGPTEYNHKLPRAEKGITMSCWAPTA